MIMRWRVAAAGLVAVGLGLAVWLGRGSAQAPAAATAASTPLAFQPDEVTTVRVQALPRSLAFSGPLVAPHSATVKAKAAGTLLSLAVDEGSRVQPGQRLGSLDLADLQARLLERESQAAAARAQWAQAERTHASNQHLAEQQFISPIALEGSRATLDAARAQHEAAKAQVESVRVALREAALVAPIAGIVAKRQALPGEKVSAEQPLLTLVDLRQLEMIGSVGTHEVGALRPGMAVSVLVEGESAPRAARLARIAPVVDSGTRSIGVAIALDNPGERLRAGQFAQATVPLAPGEPRPVVPLTALSSASGQDYVWVLEGGKLMRRGVALGRRDPGTGLAEVVQGLGAGQQVVARRIDNLREGAAARVAPAAGAAASSPAASVAASAAR